MAKHFHYGAFASAFILMLWGAYSRTFDGGDAPWLAVATGFAVSNLFFAITSKSQ